MPPKTVKKILNDVLGDLQSKNFKKFKNYLSDRDQEPRIPVSVIENADEMDIVDALVRTYTEKKAISVAIEVIRDINCLDLAEKLENYMKGRLNWALRNHYVAHRPAIVQKKITFTFSYELRIPAGT